MKVVVGKGHTHVLGKKINLPMVVETHLGISIETELIIVKIHNKVNLQV